MNENLANARRSHSLAGEVYAPGDKSISHRAVIMGAMAEGNTVIEGLLEGVDILSTIGAMRAFGAKITAQKNTAQKNSDGRQNTLWQVKGCGPRGFKRPKTDIDCGNAGTGVRLIMGAAAGYGIEARFTGDASLSVRPMNRILDPLRDMGAQAESAAGGRLPITLQAHKGLSAINYTPPIASAQVKSAILLAGLNVQGTTTVTEPVLTRDHTENMLGAFGVSVQRKPRGKKMEISVDGPKALEAAHITVPGDPSSAAFLIVAALITPDSDVMIKNVMMNPTRTGLFECLTEMGAFLRADNFRKSGGEIIADIQVKSSKLIGINVPARHAASMIDEYPILAVAASFAKGVTIMDDIGELRVKESDRISAMIAALSENGVDCEELEQGMKITGNGGKPVTGGACITTHHDHRIAMSALILGLQAENPIAIDDAAMIATSFPDFFDIMRSLGANISDAHITDADMSDGNISGAHISGAGHA